MVYIFYIGWEELRNMHKFAYEYDLGFDCPGVTLCGWQYIKIQLPTN